MILLITNPHREGLPTMSDRTIASYLLRWERAFNQGERLTPEQFCADRPELVAKVRPFVEMMRQLHDGLDQGPSTRGTDSYHSPSTRDTSSRPPTHTRWWGVTMEVGKAHRLQPVGLGISPRMPTSIDPHAVVIALPSIIVLS